MADQLEGAERERGELQEALVATQNQVEELQDQLDELSRRWGQICRMGLGQSVECFRGRGRMLPGQSVE